RRHNRPRPPRPPRRRPAGAAPAPPLPSAHPVRSPPRSAAPAPDRRSPPAAWQRFLSIWQSIASLFGRSPINRIAALTMRRALVPTPFKRFGAVTPPDCPLGRRDLVPPPASRPPACCWGGRSLRPAAPPPHPIDRKRRHAGEAEALRDGKQW